MEATGTWEGGHRTRLSDGRGHEVVVDLPLDEGGQDVGPSALELQVLALAGCISTIFLLVARRRRISLSSLVVHLEAHRPPGAATLTSVDGTFKVTTTHSLEEVSTALSITLRTCPVGVLFEQARVPVHVRPIVVPPTPPLTEPSLR